MGNYLASNLVHLRKRNRGTREELGTLLGISHAAYGKYERGDSDPSLEGLAALASHYDVTIDDLITKDMTRESVHNKANQSTNKSSTVARIDGMLARSGAVAITLRDHYVKTIAQLTGRTERQIERELEQETLEETRHMLEQLKKWRDNN